MAYFSDESGRNEVYVRPFPTGESRWQVSTDGGRQPRWSRDGKELFYVEGNALVVARVTTRPWFSVVTATRLFESRGFGDAGSHYYDVSADGQRILVPEPIHAEGREPVIQVVENWYEEFRERE
ncbi:MAG: hypothetical protein GY953_04380 [bacterium]|nr:hypothetical protein [bacterium]